MVRSKMKRIKLHIIRLFTLLLLLSAAGNQAWAADVTYHILTLPINPSVYDYHMRSELTGKRLEAVKVVVKGQTTLELPAHFKSPLATGFTYYASSDVTKSGSAVKIFENSDNPNKAYYYTINGGAHVAINKEAKVTLGDVTDLDNKVTVLVHTENGGFVLERTYVFTKFQLIEGYFNVVNIDPSYFTTYEIFMWSWGPNDGGHWSKDYTTQDGVLLINIDAYKAASASDKDKYGYKLACFAKGTTKEGSDKYTWGDDAAVLKKTSDFSFNILAQGYYDASDF